MEHGVDIHEPFRARRRSAYMLVLCGADHPFEADEKAYYWLKTLEVCGVDLSNYIGAETTLIEQFGIEPYWFAERNKEVVMLDFECLPMPSWRWKLPQESSIIEVLEEFQFLGPDLMEYRLDYVLPAGPNDIKCWKAENNIDLARYCFPFLPSLIDCILGPHDQRLNQPWCRKTYNQAVEVRDRRIARRQAKRWRKAHPGEKPPSNRMPGTWVD